LTRLSDSCREDATNWNHHQHYQQALGALENSAPTETKTLRSVLTFIERGACMLETHQSVHNEESCKICHLRQHHLRACSRFQEMDPKTRRQAITQVGVCTNCLSTAHKVENCGSAATCQISNPRGYPLLAIAKVSLQGPTRQLQTCRAVKNSGPQVNLISRIKKKSNF